MPYTDIVQVFLVGCLTGALGIGASLALPALFALGMPAATALLAFKLPLAVADLAAASSHARYGALPRARLATQLALAAVAGGCGTCLLLAPSCALPCVAVLGLVTLAAHRRRAAGDPHLVALALWMGICGLGAGLALIDFGRRRCGDPLRDAVGRARALGAAANLAAVAVVALGAVVPWADVLPLTLALALGSSAGSMGVARLGAGWHARRLPGRGAAIARDVTLASPARPSPRAAIRRWHYSR